MKQYIFIILLALFVSCIPKQNNIKIKTNKIIPKEALATIDSLVQNYHRIYGIDYRTLILDTKEIPIEKTSKGYIKTKLAHSKPGGKIYFNSLVKFPQKKELINIINHELFHTLAKSRQDSIFLRKKTLNTGVQKITFIGYYGFYIFGIIDNKEIGTLTAFIDEGAAEVCAQHITPGYTVEDIRYLRAGLLFKKLVAKKIISISEIIQFKKNGDLRGLCSKIIGRQATDNDIIKFGIIFMDIGANTIDHNIAYNRIQKLQDAP